MDEAKVDLATLEDVSDLVDLFMDCFDDEYFQKLFPPDGPGQKYMQQAWTMFIKSNELGIQEGQVYVVRDAQGTLLSLFSLPNTIGN